MKCRFLVFTLITLLVSGWWYAAVLEWRAELISKEILAGDARNDIAASTLLSASPGRYAALSMLAVGSSEYSQMEAHLADSIKLRPLYAPYWLDRAEVASRSGDLNAADQYLKRAVALWPNRPVLLWKAAMLYIRLQNPQAALRVFKRYLANYPRDYARVLAISRRLEPDATALLHAIIPEDSTHNSLRDELLRKILRKTKSQPDGELGRAVWRELPDQIRRNPGEVGFYVETMAAANNKDEALSAWRHYRPAEQWYEVDNRGFEAPLSGGLDWRVIEAEGVDIERDAEISNNGRYSLNIRFSGAANIHFDHIRKFIPVEPGASYRLTFFWRGDGITTRSGPFIYLTTVSGAGITKSDDKWGSWDWQPEDVEFAVPEHAHFVELIIKRRKTDALDNKIQGSIWLDDFSLTTIGRGEYSD